MINLITFRSEELEMATPSWCWQMIMDNEPFGYKTTPPDLPLHRIVAEADGGLYSNVKISLTG